MPYPQRSLGFRTAFMNSQRPPPGSHLSAFLHGESTMNGGRSGNRQRGTQGVSRRATAPVSEAPLDSFDSYYGPDLRPRASTLSVIDPVHSPNPASRGHDQSTMFYQYPREPSDPRTQLPGYSQAAVPGRRREKRCRWERKPVGKHHHRKKSTPTDWEKEGPKPMLFPKVQDRRVRQKSMGTLISGTLLTVILTTYLALATSNVVPTAAFHGAFIFVILILTIVFAHFLIRLCMLAFRPRNHRLPQFTMIKDLPAPVGPAARANLPHSRRPIRLLPPYSSPPPHQRQHDQGNPMAEANGAAAPVFLHARQDSNTEIDIEKALPAIPPPAYGRWRGSIRIDNPERVDLQQLTRELVMAGAREETRDERRRGRAGTGVAGGSRGGGGAGWRRRMASPSPSSSRPHLRNLHHQMQQQQEPPSYTSHPPSRDDENHVIGVHVDVDVVREENPGLGSFPPHREVRDDGDLSFRNHTRNVALAAPASFLGVGGRRERMV